VAAEQNDVSTGLRQQSLIESLAAIEHDRWSHWQRYMHEQCRLNDDGSLTIPSELVARWTKQMTTPYSSLSEAEKESDREQVRQYIPIIESALIDERQQ
jgi:hypothetical protein